MNGAADPFVRAATRAMKAGEGRSASADSQRFNQVPRKPRQSHADRRSLNVSAAGIQTAAVRENSWFSGTGFDL
jgi:hypothetical protein